ncbi:unnamed protein product [Microthlaspi erraticum]|uniref:Reverse transcriptase domain-containing protein n=1 Tax=Microthlaspi erraticum TaxID=1685480 RepID=A0A6D2HC04_9BRAS|nr:unnamed protein product [Microthlaspi erraticum]
MCFADDLILFAEAFVAQIRVIRAVLERFCEASGQKVSLEKSKIYFSANVEREQRERISGVSGIQQTCDLGKYLGMPVLQKRLNKETFGEVIARVSSRMAGWKGRVLSMAGRVTLTKSVISSIPIHSMSTIMLPQSTLAKLDQLSRGFIWGSNGETRKQHLVAWSRVCQLKNDGGLGIRSAKEMNLAMIAKMGWRLLQDKESLWASVLRRKYKIGDISERQWSIPKSNWSSTWRSIMIGMHEVIFKGAGWIAGDGRSIKFWRDKWLNGTPLLDSSTNNSPENVEIATVRNLWQDGASDSLSWTANPDGEFTVRSAYSLLTGNVTPRQNMAVFYARVWRAVVPERVRLFL